jgi:hypothetical protein
VHVGRYLFFKKHENDGSPLAPNFQADDDFFGVDLLDHNFIDVYLSKDLIGTFDKSSIKDTRGITDMPGQKHAAREWVKGLIKGSKDIIDEEVSAVSPKLDPIDDVSVPTNGAKIIPLTATDPNNSNITYKFSGPPWDSKYIRYVPDNFFAIEPKYGDEGGELIVQACNACNFCSEPQSLAVSVSSPVGISAVLGI